MRLFSLGSTCIPQLAIKLSLGQTGITSPLAWCTSTPATVLQIIQDDFNILTQQEHFIVKPSPCHTIYNTHWVHERIANENDLTQFYDKLNAQVKAIRNAFNDDKPCGFILTFRMKYITQQEYLKQIRDIIPSHHKILYCHKPFHSNDLDSTMFDNGIHVSSMYNEQFEKLGPTRAKTYGTSLEFKQIIRNAFDLT